MPLNVELLESSFSQIKDRETEFSTNFYTYLFADYPTLKPLFANSNMTEQQKKLFRSLVLIVDSLRTPDALVNTLKGLGTRHIRYGVLPEHYPMVGSTLIKSFSICLQDAWTPNIERAWIEAYATVARLMLEGLDYPAEILNPDNNLGNSELAV
jgi:hemoglobin-like flavoprotein